MPGYNFTVSGSAFHAVQACTDRDATRLANAIEFLTENPAAPATLVGPDHEGRLIPWMRVEEFAIGYLPDHSKRTIHVLEIRRVLD